MAVLKKILKWIGIFVGVLFLVVILAAIFGDKETNNKATENTQEQRKNNVNGWRLA